MTTLENLVSLENREGKVVVSSRKVAKHFEKKHKNVIRDIETLINSDSSKLSPLIIKSEYESENSNGRKYKEYLLTKDGFTLVAMGFTGKTALEWKLKYIEAFNKMEKSLSEVYKNSELAITQNIMNGLNEGLFQELDRRFEKYENNYRPTHKNKLDLDKYIKARLGIHRSKDEVKAVKDRVLLILGVSTWQDLPYKELIENMNLIEESIKVIIGFRNISNEAC